MSYWKEVARRRMEGLPDDPDDEVVVGDLATYAALLGGEVEGAFVRCPSPGRPADDRSCHVRFDKRGQPYVYGCEGHEGAAYAFLRERLSLAPAKPSKATGAFALRLLNETVSANATLVETYLRGKRGITIPIPSCLRFHDDLFHNDDRTYRPGMVAERSAPDGSIVAIHRTYLKRDGSDKADVSPPRMDLGPALGTAIRLSPVAADLMVGEGIETVLAAIELFAQPGWAGGSAGAMRRMKLPSIVQSVVVLADGDDAGEEAACAMAHRMLREGRRVAIRRAPKKQDFNDVLIAKAAK